MHKKKILILFLLINSLVYADYSRLSLAKLINMADNAIVGEIINVDKNYFTLKIDNVIIGNYSERTVDILKFRDWECAERYADYEIGQKAIVFFKRSNQLIKTFDNVGYGAGNEFEIPILDNSTVLYINNKRQPKKYKLKNFLKGIKDYYANRHKIKKLILEEDYENTFLKSFSSKSKIHLELIKESSYFTKPKNQKSESIILSNSETNYLYEGYNNILNFASSKYNIDNVFLTAKNTSISKVDNHFIINPKKGWTNRWIYIKKINKNGDTTSLHSKLFKIIPVPEPDIFISKYYRDSIPENRIKTHASPKAKYFQSNEYENDFLKYKILTYDLDLIKANSVFTIKKKSNLMNNELIEILQKAKEGDILKYYNIQVLYPDNKIKYVPEMKIYVTKKI